MPLSATGYRPRDAEHTALYRVIAKHLDAFLETARRHADGASLPGFVEHEFRGFLTCGVLARHASSPAAAGAMSISSDGGPKAVPFCARSVRAVVACGLASSVILLFALFEDGRWGRRRTRGVEAWWAAIYAAAVRLPANAGNA